MHISAASSRQNLRPIGEKPGDDAAFAVAKMRFAVIVEDVVDRFRRGSLDLIVGINEWQTELESQAFANRRLAAAHEADEDDGPLAKTFFGDVDGFGFRHLDLEAPIDAANRLVSGAENRDGLVICVVMPRTEIARKSET
jgi:hypothetical protein